MPYSDLAQVCIIVNQLKYYVYSFLQSLLIVLFTDESFPNFDNFDKMETSLLNQADSL